MLQLKKDDIKQNVAKLGSIRIIFLFTNWFELCRDHSASLDISFWPENLKWHKSWMQHDTLQAFFKSSFSLNNIHISLIQNLCRQMQSQITQDSAGQSAGTFTGLLLKNMSEKSWNNTRKVPSTLPGTKYSNEKDSDLRVGDKTLISLPCVIHST